MRFVISIFTEMLPKWAKALLALAGAASSGMAIAISVRSLIEYTKLFKVPALMNTFYISSASVLVVIIICAIIVNIRRKKKNKEKKEDLKSKMDEYINEILLKENNLIKDHRECYTFCRNLLDFNLMGYSEKHLTELIEKILQVLSSIKNEKAENDFKYNIIFFLENWTKNIFLKLKPKEVTEEQIDLYVYKALFQLKYSKYKDDIIYAYEDLKNASDIYRSQKAKQYLERESTTLEDKLIYYRNENLEEF